MKKIAILIIFLLVASVCGATNYYVAQDGAGSENGTSAANAWDLDNLNNAAYWSATENATKIDPGDTVYLSGNFTEQIYPKGSGSAGNVVTIDGTDALIKTDTNSTDKIIYMLNGHHLTYQNLDVDGQDDNMTYEGNKAAIYIREFGTETGDITIQDSVFTNSVAGVILQGSVSDVNIYRNTFSNMSNHGIGCFGDNYDEDELDDYDDCPDYLTIGGSSANGNTFTNIGFLTAGDSGIPGEVFGTTAKDAIFSYNTVSANMTDVGAGIYLNGAKRILIEHNSISSLEADNHRSYITIKSDDPLFWEDNIIRFNKVYDVYVGDNQYASPGDAIRISGEGNNTVIYGNYCEGAGINLNWNWTADNDGVGGKGYYVWANVINKTDAGGGISISGTSDNTDIFKDFYVYNNTVYKATQTPGVGSYFYGICTTELAADCTDNMNIKNNLISYTRPNDTDYIGLSIDYDANVTADYNCYYWPSQTSQVYYYGSNCTGCDWDSEDVPAGYGDNDISGDPKFADADNDNFSLLATSPCIKAGVDLTSDNSALPTITLQGIEYTFDFGDALSPDSVWPDGVVTVRQGVL
jgi:hypothetical protein